MVGTDRARSSSGRRTVAADEEHDVYHGTRNLKDLLESWGVPTGDPPQIDGPGPEPELDGYLLDASRRLALHLTDREGHAGPGDVGAYAADPLGDREAEELARGLRVISETEGVRHPTDEQRGALVEAAVEAAIDEWRTSSIFADDPDVRHTVIEERLRQAVDRLASG